MNLTEQELARALRGCIAACMKQSLTKLVRPLSKFSLKDDPETVAFLHFLLDRNLPSRPTERLYEVCELAFDEEARYHFVKLKQWAFMPDASGPRALPIPREACEKFVFSYFVSELSATAKTMIAMRAERVAKQALGMPEQALRELLRQEFFSVHSEDGPIKNGFPRKAQKRIMQEGSVLGTQWFGLFTSICVEIGMRSVEKAPPQETSRSNVVDIRRRTGGP